MHDFAGLKYGSWKKYVQKLDTLCTTVCYLLLCFSESRLGCYDHQTLPQNAEAAQNKMSNLHCNPFTSKADIKDIQGGHIPLSDNI